MSKTTPATDIEIIWCDPDGSVIACFEKIKVLNDNYRELQQAMQDALDDALLLGCSEAQVRQALGRLLDNLRPSVNEQTDSV